jgi:hypothetical protein
MNRQWRLIVICGALGLLVAAAIISYLKLFGMNDDLLTAFVILCPPSLLCIPFNEAMRNTSQFWAIWCLIGLLNCGLYAVVGSAIVGQLWKPKA